MRKLGWRKRLIERMEGAQLEAAGAEVMRSGLEAWRTRSWFVKA